MALLSVQGVTPFQRVEGGSFSLSVDDVRGISLLSSFVSAFHCTNFNKKGATPLTAITNGRN